MDRVTGTDVVLNLLAGSTLSAGGSPVRLAGGTHRLLAYLALRGRTGVRRDVVAEALWPDRRGGRAAANLRTALWHARSSGRRCLVTDSDGRLGLSGDVRVDLADVMAWAREVIAAESGPRPTGPTIVSPGTCDDAITTLARELLPDWPDPWLVFERRRWDEVRLHTLEVLARGLADQGRYLPALEAALTAVDVDPVRESAHRTVIEVHLAEGNLSSAVRHYRYYRDLVRTELGVAPSPQMERLLRPPVLR